MEKRQLETLDALLNALGLFIAWTSSLLTGYHEKAGKLSVFRWTAFC
jgi:hypothetical protein